jgi:ADP-ribose pyrophosphatase
LPVNRSNYEIANSKSQIMKAKWKIITRKDVSPSKWFPVLRDKVELPNKKVVDDYFISPLGNAVMVLAFTGNKELVMVRQYKHGVGEVVIELPAGVQQEGRSLEESALAELNEETGIRVTGEALHFIGKINSLPTKTNHITYGYLVRNARFNSIQKLDETEDIEVVLFTPKKVLEMIRSGEIWIADTVAFILKAHLEFPDLFEN